MRDIPESDWKYMRSLKPELLNRLCARINAQTSRLLADRQLSEHERYLKVYKHIHASDEVIDDCFNDWRRSRFFDHLLSLRYHKVITEEELAGLSEETQAIVRLFNEL